MLTPIIHKLVRLPATILLALIWCYQRILSPVFGRQCRFYPTCSNFACDAIVHHGACKGSLLAIWRICRCNPLCDGGIDPVPERFSLKQLLHSSPTSSHHNGSQT